LHARLPGLRRGRRRQRGPAARLPRQERPGREHHRHLHLRPGLLPGRPQLVRKRFMYEESLRMPFLVRWPAKVKAGTVNDGMIINADFAPTLLACAGEKVPADMQGQSFLPLLQGEKPKDWRTSMYYRYYHYPMHHKVQPHYGVRTERYKLIYFNKI